MTEIVTNQVAQWGAIGVLFFVLFTVIYTGWDFLKKREATHEVRLDQLHNAHVAERKAMDDEHRKERDILYKSLMELGRSFQASVDRNSEITTKVATLIESKL